MSETEAKPAAEPVDVHTEVPDGKVAMCRLDGTARTFVDDTDSAVRKGLRAGLVLASPRKAADAKVLLRHPETNGEVTLLESQAGEIRARKAEGFLPLKEWAEKRKKATQKTVETPKKS